MKRLRADRAARSSGCAAAVDQTLPSGSKVGRSCALVVGDEPGDLRRQLAVAEAARRSPPRRRCSSANSRLPSETRRGTSSVAPGEHPGQRCVPAEQFPRISSSRLATVVREPGQPVERATDLAGGVAERRGERLQARGELLACRAGRWCRTGRRTAATTSSGDAVRANGIGVAGSSGPLPCGSSARYLAPSRVRIWIEALVWSPTHAVPVDGERDAHVVAVELHGPDAARLDARDRHEVTRLQARGFGEVGAVGRGRREQGGRVERDQHDDGQHSEAADGERHRAAGHGTPATTGSSGGLWPPLPAGSGPQRGEDERNTGMSCAGTMSPTPIRPSALQR